MKMQWASTLIRLYSCTAAITKEQLQASAGVFHDNGLGVGGSVGRPGTTLIFIGGCQLPVYCARSDPHSLAAVVSCHSSTELAG